MIKLIYLKWYFDGCMRWSESRVGRVINLEIYVIFDVGMLEKVENEWKQMNFNWQIFDSGRVREIWESFLRENGISWVVKTQGMGEVSQGKWRDLRTRCWGSQVFIGPTEQGEKSCGNKLGRVSIWGLLIIYFIWWKYFIIMDLKNNV